jgi:hypothetical protein
MIHTACKFVLISISIQNSTTFFPFIRTEASLFVHIVKKKIFDLLVFTGCGDGVARAYDAKSATLKRLFQGHEGAINCLVCVDDKLYTGKFT